jgi:hypothetical protein
VQQRGAGDAVADVVKLHVARERGECYSSRRRLERRTSTRMGSSGFCSFRSRTPGPPPFSGMNSTPPASRAMRSFVMVLASVSEPFSNRVIVLIPTEASVANSRALHPSAPRAILH